MSEVEIKIGKKSGCSLSCFGKHNDKVDLACMQRVSSMVSDTKDETVIKLFEIVSNELDKYNYVK